MSNTSYLQNQVVAYNRSNETVTVYVESNGETGRKTLTTGSCKIIIPYFCSYESQGISQHVYIKVTYQKSGQVLTKSGYYIGQIMIENDRVYMRDDITGDLKKICTIL